MAYIQAFNDYNGKKMQEISERLRAIRLNNKKSQLEMARYIGIPQRTWSNYESGKTEIPIHVLLKLEQLGYSMGWIIKGDNDELEGPANKIAITINKSDLQNAENIANVTMFPNKENPISLLPAIPNTNQQEPMKNISVFTIPLLTKEQVLHFEPGKEIPNPKAHTGDSPDYTLIPIPRRFQEYSTDLRAMVVFNSLMSPLLNQGDVTIFQATGWNEDGVYIYRMSGDLHISHVKSCGRVYQLTKEFRPDEEISFDVGSFEAIGRVRAVVREIG